MTNIEAPIPHYERITPPESSSFNITTREGRRNIVVSGLQLKSVFPHEVYADPRSIEKAHELIESGYGIIVPYTHPDMRSPIDGVNSLIELGGKFTDAEYVGPLAWHQQHYPHLKALSKITDIPLLPIVTSNTRERGKDIEVFSMKEKLKRKGQKMLKKDVPEPKQVSFRQGLFEYLQEGAEVLLEGGVVFIAPQGGRKNSLGEPLGATQMLVDKTKKVHQKSNVDDELKIAIWPVSVAPKGITEFSDDTAGMNRGMIAEITFGNPRTLSDIETEIASRDEINGKKAIDTVVFEELTKIIPPTYR